jgi:hypothetical protein
MEVTPEREGKLARRAEVYEFAGPAASTAENAEKQRTQYDINRTL